MRLSGQRLVEGLETPGVRLSYPGQEEGGALGHLQTQLGECLLPSPRSCPWLLPLTRTRGHEDMGTRTRRVLVAPPTGGLTLPVAPEPRAAEATNRLSPLPPSPFQGWERHSGPQSGLRCGALEKPSLRRAAGLQCPETLAVLLKTLPLPSPLPMKAFFKQSHFWERRKGWTSICLDNLGLSDSPTAWKREGPGCHRNSSPRLRRHQELGLQPHGVPVQLASALAWGPKDPRPRGDRAILHPGRSSFLLMALVLRNFCLVLTPPLPSVPPSFSYKALPLALCSLPRTSPCHFSFHPWSHSGWGKGSMQQSAEIRRLGAESCQLSSEWQPPGPQA